LSVVAPVAAAIRSTLQKPFRVFSSGGATYGYWKGLQRTYGGLEQYTYGDMEFERVLVMPVDAVNLPVTSNNASPQSFRIVGTAFASAAFVAHDATLKSAQIPTPASSTFLALPAEVASERTTQGALAGSQFAANEAHPKVQGIALSAADALWEAHSASPATSRVTSADTVNLAAESIFAQAQPSISVQVVEGNVELQANGAEVARGASPDSVNVFFAGQDAAKQSPRAVDAGANSVEISVPAPTVVATGFIKPPAWELSFEVQTVTVQSSCSRSVEPVEAVFAPKAVSLEVSRSAVAFAGAAIIANANSAQPLVGQIPQTAGAQFEVSPAERVAIRSVGAPTVAATLSALSPQPRIRQAVDAAAILVSGIAVERAATRAVETTAIAGVLSVVPPSLVIAARRAPSILSLLFGIPRPFPRRIDDPIATDWTGDVYRNAPTPPPRRRHYLRGYVRQK